MIQIFHKNAPGMECHIAPLKILNLGKWIRNHSNFEIEPNMKWIPIEYFRDFQIHFSNTLFEEVMSSSLHDLNWINLNSKAKGKVILFPLIPS